MPTRSNLVHHVIAVAAAVACPALSIAEVADGEAYDKVFPSVVRITVTGTAQTSSGGTKGITNVGTGFFISPDGLIATAFHVVGWDDDIGHIAWAEKDGKKLGHIKVEMPNAQGVPAPYPYEAELVKPFETEDIALIKLPGNGFPAARCMTVRFKVHSHVLGIGYREGLPNYDPLNGETASVQPGVGDRYRITEFGGIKGHSGGPVFDGRGRVRGIITSGFDFKLHLPGTPNESYATPLDVLSPHLPSTVDCQKSEDIWDHFRVFVSGEVPAVERESRTASFEERNDHCQPPANLDRYFPPREGWKIDPTSIEASASVVSSNSVFRGVVSSSESGFHISGTVRNAGFCGPALPGGARLGVDARGTLKGSVTWQEYREVPRAFNAEAAAGPNDAAAIVEIPSNLTSPRVRVVDGKGREQTFTSSEASSGVRVDINKVTGRVVVRPST